MTIFIKNFDKIMQERMDEIDADIADATRIMNDHLAKGDTEKAEKKQSEIDWRTKRKEYTVADLKGKLKQRTALVAQIKGSLKAAGKKGDLPFDADIADNPENFVVTRGGVVLCVGKYYMIRSTIIQITSVDQLGRKVKYTYPMSHRGDENTAEIDKMQDLSETDLSASDIAWLKLDDYSFKYAKLAEVSRAKFDERKSGIATTSYMRQKEVLYRDELGLITFGSWMNGNEQYDCIYPDATDEALKKELIAGYRAALYGDYQKVKITTPSYADFMPAFFGDDWKTIAIDGLPVMQPQELEESVSKAISSVMSTFRDDWMQTNKGGYTDDDKASLGWLQAEYKAVRAAASEGFRSSVYKLMNAQVMEDFGTGNYVNTDDVRPVMVRALNSYCELVNGKVEALRTVISKRELEAADKAKAEKEAEKRKNPGFKEVPVEWVKKFSDINLDVWINDDDIGHDVPAFSFIFLKDRLSRGGKLYPAKDILKARYKAKFFGDRYVPSRYMTTWRVPANTPIDALFEIID
jgi:hypothetical protein